MYIFSYIYGVFYMVLCIYIIVYIIDMILSEYIIIILYLNIKKVTNTNRLLYNKIALDIYFYRYLFLLSIYLYIINYISVL